MIAAVIFGFAFGALLEYARVNRNDVIVGQFEVRLIHSRWEKYKGDRPSRRIIWSLVGGFPLIFGARMAGGCTSGLILSGGMQLAKSGLIFAAFAFIAFILNGKLFYSDQQEKAS